MARRSVTRIEGLDELTRDLARLSGRVGVAVRRAVRASAEAVVADARPNIPRRTGQLESELDVTYRHGGEDAEIGYADAYYGYFVEFGTLKDPAQPALTPAAERERPKFPSRVRDEIRREIG